MAALRQSVGTETAGMGGRSEIRRQRRTLRRRTESPEGSLGAAQDRHRRALRHTHPRLQDQYRKHAAAMAIGSSRVLRLRHIQQRRLLRGGKSKGGLGKPEQSALSERRAGARQGAAPGATVFLRVLFPPGHDADPAYAKNNRGSISREIRGAAQ